MRQIERIQVSKESLADIIELIKETVKPIREGGYEYSNDGITGFIVQSNNVVMHKADGSLKCWYI